MNHILIVDDEPEIQELLSIQLEKDDRVFVFASNGEEALKKMKENNFVLMISDLAMPKMNGFELLRKIKQNNFSFEMIILTGHADSLVANQLRPYGVQHFINKPWSKEDLESLVTKIIDKK